MDPNPFNDVLLTEQKKKYEHHFEKMKTTKAHTDSKKPLRQGDLTDFTLNTDVKTIEEEDQEGVIEKRPRRISTMNTFSP